MADSGDKAKLVHVEIFGQSYAIRAGAEPGYVEQLAAYVDSEMREISRSGGAVDSVRIAVLAALNIADACFQLAKARRRRLSSFPERSPALCVMDPETSNQRLYPGDPESRRGVHASATRKPEAACRVPTW